MNNDSLKTVFSKCKINSNLAFSVGKTDAPCLSIMIPTFRRRELLREALRSVLQQETSFEYEVVVIDNDDAAEHDCELSLFCENLIRDGVSLHYYRNAENIGMFNNWNRCFELARCDWVSILNDDDLLGPKFVGWAVNACASEPNALLFRCEHAEIDRRKSREVQISAFSNSEFLTLRVSHLHELCLHNRWAGCLGVVYKKVDAMCVGGFCESQFPTADYQLHIRILSRGEGYETSEIHTVCGIGENESMKAEVLAGFVSKDYALRLSMRSLFKNRYLYDAYAFFTIGAQYYNLKEKWGVKFNKELIGEGQEFGRAIMFPLNVVNFIIPRVARRICLKVIRRAEGLDKA